VFGSEFRPRRPILLLLVFGAFLALVGITASAQAMIVSTEWSTATLNSVVGSDAATTRMFVNGVLVEEDLVPGGVSAARRAALGTALATLTRRGEIGYAELRLPDGTLVAASQAAAGGGDVALNADFTAASGGDPKAAIVPRDQAVIPADAVAGRAILREYLPLESGGATRAVMVIWREADPILAELDQVRGNVVLATLSAALIAAVILFLVFRAAQGRISRQTSQILESARHDALTSTLNHGAIVAHLAERIEADRRTGGTVVLALIDVDGFRLLNDNHGHTAGDEALRTVAALIREHAEEGTVIGRYGPDEFLLIGPESATTDLVASVERIREALAEQSLSFADSERLPLTISAGIATYPANGASVTVLLSTLGHTLEAAKASGGDAVRLADAEADARPSSSFDVLQGLVFAVDTKDRYTKRHSEDVAGYAVFLARRLGLDDVVLDTIHTAGLLHDVGKIGIPDAVLRKPGRLTAEEFDVLKQHVALGDLIVRDVPQLDLVRAGIRHHHERWDGRGYLDELRAEEIPLIARILAVADAFSAMTTTRPYRKALDIREALRRIQDAAGTQLDERLVATFVEGLEEAPDAPLPGVEGRARLWTPTARVA
jgi:diguanylate cyclase (GGDEF)-like protein